MSEQLYRAEGKRVFKNPVEHKRADGSASISLGFPVCDVSEFIGDEGAKNIALMLHEAERHEALVEALKAAKGHLLNAKIDLETGAKKATAISTIEGGIRIVDAALSDTERETK